MVPERERTRVTDRLVELVDEKFDLAFRSGTVKDTSLVAHELGRAQLRCFAAREYLRDRGTPRTPRDLLRHDCILFTPLAPRGRWTFRSRGRAVEVPVRGRLVVNSSPTRRADTTETQSSALTNGCVSGQPCTLTIPVPQGLTA
jgi:hypothetical protein